MEEQAQCLRCSLPCTEMPGGFVVSASILKSPPASVPSYKCLACHGWKMVIAQLCRCTMLPWDGRMGGGHTLISVDAQVNQPLLQSTNTAFLLFFQLAVTSDTSKYPWDLHTSVNCFLHSGPKRPPNMKFSATLKYVGSYKNPQETWCKPFLKACGNIIKEGYWSKRAFQIHLLK